MQSARFILGWYGGGAVCCEAVETLSLLNVRPVYVTVLCQPSLRLLEALVVALVASVHMRC